MFRVKINGYYEDEEFSTEEQAEEYARYLCSCAREGAEVLHLSNPGDYDADDYNEPEYEIVEE